jgi:3-dehydroquinate dehydratase-1
MEFCYTLQERKKEAVVKIVQSGDLYEVRLDKANFQINDIHKIFSASTNLMATFRPVKGIADSDRFEALKTAINAGARFVDLEHDLNKKYFNELMLIARTNGCSVIVSYHDYEKTDGIHELRVIAQKCKDLGADLVKIATNINHIEDIKNLLALYAYIHDILVIGMGDKGSLTRLMSMYYQAPLVYTFFNPKNKVADGQLSDKELVKLHKFLTSKV